MTMCYAGGGQCLCQPDEGMECPYLPQAVQQEMAALRKDAERYRFWRKRWCSAMNALVRDRVETAATWDAPLDAAMKELAE